jgi:hypothetical protein
VDGVRAVAEAHDELREVAAFDDLDEENAPAVDVEPLLDDEALRDLEAPSASAFSIASPRSSTS